MEFRSLVTALAAAGGIACAQAAQAAALSNAVALWNFDSLNDANGLNSALTIVDAADGATGTIGVNIDGGGFWSGEGPGSDDRYANNRTGSDRAGTWFDAGQGAANELQITGAHTILWRGEFKDTTITGYLWSKYDHATGPTSTKNRSAFLRYNPGGSLRYDVDDGDGGAAGVAVELAAGAVTTGGNKYEIASVFDPANDQAALYILDPATRAVLASSTASVSFDTVDMDGPVPFVLGDRITWNGSGWQSIGASGARVDVEMFAVWDQALSLTDLQNLAAVPEPASLTLLALSGLAMFRRRRA